MTKAEQSIRRRLLQRFPGLTARLALTQIHDALWPNADPSREWSPRTLDEIAAIFDFYLPHSKSKETP